MQLAVSFSHNITTFNIHCHLLLTITCLLLQSTASHHCHWYLLLPSYPRTIACIIANIDIGGNPPPVAATCGQDHQILCSPPQQNKSCRGEAPKSGWQSLLSSVPTADRYLHGGNGEDVKAPWLMQLPYQRKFPLDSSISSRRKCPPEVGVEQHFLHGQDLVNLALYWMCFSKTNINEVCANVYNYNIANPLYSQSQIYRAEFWCGLLQKAATSPSDFAYTPAHKFQALWVFIDIECTRYLINSDESVYAQLSEPKLWTEGGGVIWLWEIVLLVHCCILQKVVGDRHSNLVSVTNSGSHAQQFLCGCYLLGLNLVMFWK